MARAARINDVPKEPSRERHSRTKPNAFYAACEHRLVSLWPLLSHTLHLHAPPLRAYLTWIVTLTFVPHLPDGHKTMGRRTLPQHDYGRWTQGPLYQLGKPLGNSASVIWPLA